MAICGPDHLSMWSEWWDSSVSLGCPLHTFTWSCPLHPGCVLIPGVNGACEAPRSIMKLGEDPWSTVKLSEVILCDLRHSLLQEPQRSFKNFKECVFLSGNMPYICCFDSDLPPSVQTLILCTHRLCCKHIKSENQWSSILQCRCIRRRGRFLYGLKGWSLKDF